MTGFEIGAATAGIGVLLGCAFMVGVCSYVFIDPCHRLRSAEV